MRKIRTELPQAESNPVGGVPGARDAGVPAPEAGDELLVRRALTAGGEGGAFDQLVLRYQDRIYRMLYRMSGSAEEAEDLAQETFLRAFRALANFEQGSRFYTWLFRIAVNTCYSQRRSQMRRQAHEGVHMDQGEDGEGQGMGPCAVAGADSDPAWLLDRQLTRERVREGLRQMDRDYKAVLILRDVEGMDYDTIAGTLGLTRSAVKSRLHRARLELAKSLKDLRPVKGPQP